MEKTQNSTAKKQETLLLDIHNIEMQITEVKEKMHELENEEKQENYQKNFLEVKKDNLKCSIELCRNESKKTDKQLEEKIGAFSKLSMMDECYDKLLDVYSNKYLSQENPNPCQENSLEESIYFQKETDNSKKQIDNLTSIINQNSSTIKNYLEDMHYVIQ